MPARRQQAQAFPRASEPSAHPVYAGVETLYIKTTAHVQLGALQRTAVTIEGEEWAIQPWELDAAARKAHQDACTLTGQG